LAESGEDVTIIWSFKLNVLAAATMMALAGCSSAEDESESIVETDVEAISTSASSTTILSDVWADNWFSFYLNDQLIAEDAVPITTERSFNKESFVFEAERPFVLNFITMDFRENDTGLEYIGTNRQKMGDGGLIAQFVSETEGVIALTDDSWRCLVIHDAPTERSCEAEANPVAGEGACGFTALSEPDGWKLPGFDDSNWPFATLHTEQDVDPKDGYDEVRWVDAARLIWGPDLETNNTLLCRLLIE